MSSYSVGADYSFRIVILLFLKDKQVVCGKLKTVKKNLQDAGEKYAYLFTLALPPIISAFTSSMSAMVVSPGVVMARAP